MTDYSMLYFLRFVKANRPKTAGAERHKMKTPAEDKRVIDKISNPCRFGDRDISVLYTMPLSVTIL